APESLGVVADEKQVQAARRVPVDSRWPRWVSGARAIGAWTFSEHPEIPVRIERRPARFSAVVATSVNPRSRSVDVDTLIVFQLESGGSDRLRSGVPAAAAESTRIASNDPVEAPLLQTTREAAGDGGGTAWTVVLPRETAGIVPIRVQYTLTPVVREG